MNKYKPLEWSHSIECIVSETTSTAFGYQASYIINMVDDKYELIITNIHKVQSKFMFDYIHEAYEWADWTNGRMISQAQNEIDRWKV